MWYDKASQNLQLIGFRISDGEFRFSFCNWLIILGIVLCPIMWLGSPKNMKWVSGFLNIDWIYVYAYFYFYISVFDFFGFRGIACLSVVTVVTVSILIWICIMDDDTASDRPFNGIKLGALCKKLPTQSHTVVFMCWLLWCQRKQAQKVKLLITFVDQPDYITMLKVYGMIAFQFDIHPMLMTIEVDMQHRRKVGIAVCYGIFGIIWLMQFQ